MTPVLIGAAIVGILYLGSRMSATARVYRKKRSADGGDGSASVGSDGGSDGCSGDGGGGCD